MNIFSNIGITELIVILLLALLVVGWLLALLLAAITRSALKRTTIDNRIAQWVMGEEKAEAFPVERWAGKVVFYTVLLLAVVALLNQLNLDLVSEPLRALLNTVFGYIPKVFGAAVLLGVAWLIATALRRVLTFALEKFNLDERVGGQAGLEEETLLAQLEELAQALDVEVRYEPMRREGPTFPGGLCRLKGKYVLIIDSKAGTRDKIETLARAANRFDLSQVYLRPGVREFLDGQTTPEDNL